MKSRVILFKTSGIFKIILAGCVFALFLLVILFSGLLKNFYLDNPTLLDEVIKQTIETDPSQAFLETMERSQAVEYIMKPVIQLSVFCVIYGLIGIAFGVFNLIFARKYDAMIADKTSQKVLFVVLQFVFGIGIITNILSTVAVFLKEKKKIE